MLSDFFIKSVSFVHFLCFMGTIISHAFNACLMILIVNMCLDTWSIFRAACSRFIIPEARFTWLHPCRLNLSGCHYLPKHHMSHVTDTNNEHIKVIKCPGNPYLTFEWTVKYSTDSSCGYSCRETQLAVREESQMRQEEIIPNLRHLQLNLTIKNVGFKCWFQVLSPYSRTSYDIS